MRINTAAVPIMSINKDRIPKKIILESFKIYDNSYLINNGIVLRYLLIIKYKLI